MTRLTFLGVNGFMLGAVKSLYTDVRCCVKLGMGSLTTDWFNVNSGLRQGCLVSPLLFNIYINDLAMTIKEKCKGISLDNGNKLCLLMYADDIAFLAESEQDLQAMLTVLEKWCNVWDVSVNTKKSQVVHFRKTKDVATDFDFKFNKLSLCKVNQYKYLGLIIDYGLDYKVTAQYVAKSANRALGLLIAKAKLFGGLSYKCFTKLYESMVIPIIRYGAAVWGHREFSEIDAVHNRMCRYYLGVSKYTPNAAVRGDMGTRVPWQHQKLELARQWCRLANMPNGRINKKIFMWSKSVRGRNWPQRVCTLLYQCNLQVYCDAEIIVKSTFIKDVNEQLEIIHGTKWLDIVNKKVSKCKKGKNKLRTYNTFKSEFVSECYVYSIMPKCHRSAMAQLRCGTAPIQIEIGRYTGVPEQERICPLCHSSVENELHVITECPVYNDIRHNLFKKLQCKFDGLMCFSKDMLLKLILSCNDEILVKDCARACHDILNLRRQLLYHE